MSTDDFDAAFNRRRFLGTAAMTMAAAQLGMIGSATAQSGNKRPSSVPAIKPGTNTSLGSLKQIDAGLLSVGYAEAGPSDGPAVILLHGWPYDIYSFVDVAPLLASADRCSACLPSINPPRRAPALRGRNTPPSAPLHHPPHLLRNRQSSRRSMAPTMATRIRSLSPMTPPSRSSPSASPLPIQQSRSAPWCMATISFSRST